MNLEQIKIRAAQEADHIEEIFAAVKDTVKKYPTGMDMFVPKDAQETIAALCDAQNIPFYIVTQSTCSVALTYKFLLSREEIR